MPERKSETQTQYDTEASPKQCIGFFASPHTQSSAPFRMKRPEVDHLPPSVMLDILRRKLGHPLLEFSKTRSKTRTQAAIDGSAGFEIAATVFNTLSDLSF